MKTIIVGILVTLIGMGLVYRDKGRWYEYVMVGIIGLFVTFWLLFII